MHFIGCHYRKCFKRFFSVLFNLLLVLFLTIIVVTSGVSNLTLPANTDFCSKFKYNLLYLCYFTCYRFTLVFKSFYCQLPDAIKIVFYFLVPGKTAFSFCFANETTAKGHAQLPTKPVSSVLFSITQKFTS